MNVLSIVDRFLHFLARSISSIDFCLLAFRIFFFFFLSETYKMVFWTCADAHSRAQSGHRTETIGGHN